MRGGLRPPGIIALTVLSSISRALARLTAVAARLGGDRRGNVAIIFALCLPTLVMVVLGGMDVQRITTVRSNLQDALDAATLAAARSPHIKEDELTAVGLAALKANLRGYPGVTFRDEDIVFKIENGVIVADAQVQVKTIVANIVLPPYGKLMDDTLPVGAHSEVNRAMDVEVALVLDITGSMKGSRLDDLKRAATDLVEAVVKPSTDLGGTRTRVALVPYSMGVNAGPYAALARGGIRGQTDIDAASWAKASAVNVGGVTKGAQTTIRATGHQLQTGDYVWVSGIISTNARRTNSLADRLNDAVYRVERVNANEIRLQQKNGAGWTDVNTSSGYDVYSSSGSVRACHVETCEVVVTSQMHGLRDGDSIRIANVQGLTLLNNDNRSARRLTDNTFIVAGVRPNDVASQTYRTGGSDYVQCLELGCLYYRFTNYSNSIRIQKASSCVSERIGSAAYSDASPGGAPVGLAYPGDDNPCLNSEIRPLTDEKQTLLRDIESYDAVGSTAGQIGVEWGWYMVSPTFGSIFPTDGQPDAYDAERRLKVVILMTDGEFNTPYCDGVVAGAVSGSGDTRYHIKCSPYTDSPLKAQPAGEYTNPFARSVETCAQMKKAGVVVYTVGFAISNNEGGAGVDTAVEVMRQCATSPRYVYLPETGGSLRDSFGEIARSIGQLRISR